MLSKNDIKLIRSLTQGKYRKKHSLFIVEGGKIIREFHKHGTEFERLFYLDGAEIPEGLNGEVIKAKELGQISQLSTPNDSLALIKLPDQNRVEVKKVGKKLMLACEKVQDPGNMGTIIRIADWFGIDDLVCSPDCADVYSGKVVQASMGSLARVRVSYQDLTELINALKAEDKTYPIVTSSLKGQNIFSSNLPERGMVVLGNESKGVSGKIQDRSDLLLKIPSFGGAESLNVAVSAGIILAEFRRRS
ncbi:MAG TPA: RNA methyltransferase [Flavobacteriales bacterium]|nr:RNA methyltransferase [Flavobacteriales bacterium]